MEMNELPEENDVHSENYKKVPIEDFGRALLRGMGWDGKTGLDSKTYVQISSIEKSQLGNQSSSSSSGIGCHGLG